MFNRKKTRALTAEITALEMRIHILEQMIENITAKRRRAARQGWVTRREVVRDERQETTTTNGKGE
jgi:hypothetical protein